MEREEGGRRDGEGVRRDRERVRRDGEGKNGGGRGESRHNGYVYIMVKAIEPRATRRWVGLAT